MEDSGSSPSGEPQELVDPSGLHFTATYDDGTTGSVNYSSYTPERFGDTTGTIPVTFSFEGTDITVEVDYDVQEPAEPVLESLEITGSLTNTQYYGEAPDLTGLTVKAVYDNGDKETLDVSDLTISPVTWTLPGTISEIPFEDDLTISYTEDEVTVTSGVDNVAIHGKSSYTIPLKPAAAIVYYDGFSIPEWTQASDVAITAGADLFYGSATPQIGDWVFLQFDQSAYDNDTTVDATIFNGYLADFGADAQNWAPHVGAVGDGYGMQYSTVAITGQGNAQTDATGYNVAGKLVNAITGSTGYKLSDISTTDRHVTSVTFTVPTPVLPVTVTKTYSVNSPVNENITFADCLTAADVANLIQPNGQVDDGQGNYYPCHGMWLNLSDFSNETVSTDNVFWYFIPKADYDLDSTLPTASDIGYTDGIGWGLGTAEESGTSWVFAWQQSGNPQSSISADTQYVMVLGRVKSGISSAATSTLKPSDLDELAKLIVTETVPAPTHVVSFTASPDHFTTPQYYGDYPSASYSDFTFTAHLSDGTDDVGVTPTYGNPPGYPEPDLIPKNFDVQNARFEYVYPSDSQYSATATVPTVVHRKEQQFINGGGTLIFDFQQEWMTDLNKGASDVITNGASDGELCLTIYDETSYISDHTIDSTAYSTLLSTYNISTTESGTPNQLGYQPATGYNKGTTLSDCCVAYVATDKPNLYTDTTVYIVIAEADGALSAGGYKLSDFKSAGRVVYRVHVAGKRLITGVSIDDTDLPEQSVGTWVNIEGCPVTITFSNGDTEEYDGGELVTGDSSYDGLIPSGTAIDATGQWTTSGTQSATFTVNDVADSFWLEAGIDVASPAPSTTLTGITVQE